MADYGAGMSKVDALRALREAKYAADRAAAPAGTLKKLAAARPAAATSGSPATGTKPVRASRTGRPGSAAVDAAPVDTVAGETEALCGHRNMGGKSCTRAENHSEKNHRYS